MMGRNRSMLASWMACSADSPALDPLAGEVHDHDPVLLDDSHQHEHADECVERRLLPEQKQRQQPSHQGRRKRRKHRDRVDIALIENGQNHVHDEHRQRHQDGQISDRVLERQGLALQARSHGRRHDPLPRPC